MKFKSITLIVAALAFGSLSLQAKDKKPKGGGGDNYNADEVVKKFDKNGDGKLSIEEFSAMKKWAKDKDPAAAAKEAFTAADADKDGSVTAAELKAVHEKKMEKGKEKGEEKPTAPPSKAEGAK